MMRFWAILCLGLLGGRAEAQPPGLPEGFGDRAKQTIASASRQFTIYDVPAGAARPLELNNAAQTNIVRQDARTLSVTCERIKAALLKELGAGTEWQGKIAVYLHRAADFNEQLVIRTEGSGDGWMYFLYVPDTTDRTRLASAVVSVLLLEMANRNAGQSAEIPPWLGQGLTRELMLSAVVPLLVEPPQRYGALQTFLPLYGVRNDPLKRAHEELRAQAPLTLEELSWPDDGQEESETFRDSAQLFVHELLALPGGRASLLAMVRNLTHHYNWQMTFQEAFQSNFSDGLAVEKWWALKLANFTGRDLTRTWPSAESWVKLDEMLRATVGVRSAPEELPLRSEVSLQTIIRDWDYADQAGLLKTKVQQLFLFRNWVSQDVIHTVDEYRSALNTYILRREQSRLVARGRTQAVMGLDPDARETIQRLDDLDTLRRAATPKTDAAPPVAASTPVNR